MDWSVSLDPHALTELQKLDRTAQKRILRFLRERLAGRSDPRLSGKPLSGEKAGLWRYRVGDYRMVSLINDAQRSVLVLRIAHRKDVYR